MKTSLKLLTLLSIGLVLGLINCKDDPADPADPTPVTKTKKELITDSTWKLYACVNDVPIDYDGVNGVSKDVYSQMPPCETDDIFRFSDTTNTAITYVNAKCPPPKDTRAKYGKWNFSADEKTLVWYTLSYELAELTDKKMVLKRTFKYGMDTYNFTETYVHQ